MTPIIKKKIPIFKTSLQLIDVVPALFMYTINGFIHFLLWNWIKPKIFKWLDSWKTTYFHPCVILIWSVHAFMIAISLIENCTPPLKCVYFSNDFFFNLIDVSPSILENKSDQSEEPVGPTLTSHRSAWNALPVTPFPAPTSLYPVSSKYSPEPSLMPLYLPPHSPPFLPTSPHLPPP